MRCAVCNVMLSDFESTRKHADTGEYLDMCCKCVAYTKTPTIDNYDLVDNEDLANMSLSPDIDDNWMIDFED
jgi:hypothetical protein